MISKISSGSVQLKPTKIHTQNQLLQPWTVQKTYTLSLKHTEICMEEGILIFNTTILIQLWMKGKKNINLKISQRKNISYNLAKPETLLGCQIYFCLPYSYIADNVMGLPQGMSQFSHKITFTNRCFRWMEIKKTESKEKDHFLSGHFLRGSHYI